MPDANTLIIVALASLVLVVVPGPAVIYILTRSVSQGRTAGLASAFGVNLGSAIHVLAAVAGLSLILASSAAAYATLKWLGVAYLAWIGYRTLRADDTGFTAPDTTPRSLRRTFTQGIIVNVLNPKIAIFFLAFLPQFVDTSSPNPQLQTLILGMTLVTIGLISDSIYALAGGALADVFRRKPGAARVTRITAGFTYIGLAGLAAFGAARK